MTRRTVVRLNFAALAVGVALIIGGLFLPALPGILTLAVGAGLIMFCSVVGVVLLLTGKRDA